jgi:hypothetical protein
MTDGGQITFAPPSESPTPPLGRGEKQAAQASGATPSAGTALQQMLYADLLLKTLHSQTRANEELSFLSLHSLESGGGQLTKSNLFLGSRNYFSGGAVATFALFGGDGKSKCTGIVYGYKGYLRDNKVEAEINNPKPPTTAVLSNCKATGEK